MARRRRLAVTAALVPVASAFPWRPAVAQESVIQPGASIVSGGSYCTLNWVYDGVLTPEEAAEHDPRVFVGTAAHCVSGVGAEVSLATGSLGEETMPIGEVVLSEFQDHNEELDYALIAVDPEHHDLVDASLMGHPAIPTGVSTSQSQGDLIQFSGNGVGWHLTEPTREERVGVLAYNNDLCQHYVNGPITPGDSGGPVANLDDGGAALGLVSTWNVGAGTSFVGYAEGGVSLPCMFEAADAHGITIELRTVVDSAETPAR